MPLEEQLKKERCLLVPPLCAAKLSERKELLLFDGEEHRSSAEELWGVDALYRSLRLSLCCRPCLLFRPTRLHSPPPLLLRRTFRSFWTVVATTPMSTARCVLQLSRMRGRSSLPGLERATNNGCATPQSGRCLAHWPSAPTAPKQRPRSP